MADQNTNQLTPVQVECLFYVYNGCERGNRFSQETIDKLIQERFIDINTSGFPVTSYKGRQLVESIINSLDKVGIPGKPEKPNLEDSFEERVKYYISKWNVDMPKHEPFVANIPNLTDLLTDIIDLQNKALKFSLKRN